MFEQKQDQDTIVYPKHKTKTQQCILTQINIMLKIVKLKIEYIYINIYIKCNVEKLVKLIMEYIQKNKNVKLKFV